MVKKGRRKTPGPSGIKRSLEVNIAESSRKFITCIRKYVLFYLKLLEETGDVSTLERAYNSLRSDKRFSLCLEDLVPVAAGRYIKALNIPINQAGTGSDIATNQVEHLLEKLFNLFWEQVNLWSDICNLPELKSPQLTETILYGYVYQYIQLLERNIKVETLDGINEKIRKRLKNPKLSNTNVAKVYKHVSASWCRPLVISMALVTPLHSKLFTDIHGMNISVSGMETEQLLCVDLQSEELWGPASDGLTSVFDPDVFKKVLGGFIPAAVVNLGQAILGVIFSWQARRSMSFHVNLSYNLKVIFSRCVRGENSKTSWMDSILAGFSEQIPTSFGKWFQIFVLGDVGPECRQTGGVELIFPSVTRDVDCDHYCLKYVKRARGTNTDLLAHSELECSEF